jgi:hypothetical protein
LATIDGDLPENQDPKQELEAEEDIRVHFVDMDEHLCDSLTALAKQNGYEIYTGLWMFAVGHCFNRIMMK